MVARKVPKEVQQIFDKYIQNNVRRLKKPDAIHMLETEFSLSADQAEQMFESFDKDKNGIMSLWEFQQFYMCVGNSAEEMVKKFQEMDADGSGKLDADEARAGIKSLGQPLEEKAIDFFIKSCQGDDGMIDLGHFVNLLFRLKMYDSKQKKK